MAHRGKEHLRTFIIQVFIAGITSGLFIFLITQYHWFNFIFGFLIGILAYSGISFFENFIRPGLNRLNFFLSVIVSTFVYIFVILLAVFITLAVFSGFSVIVIKRSFPEIMVSNTMLYGLLFGLILSFLFNSYSMFNTLLGRNFLFKVFTGRYHKPFEEERIFMFLDIRSSTTMAEKLGHKKFLSLLNDFFFDLAEPVEKTHGEIYKYVGDEAIITWKMKTGLDKENALRCFFMFRDKIDSNKEKYLSRYGLIPDFKAGMHGGIVVTGEMGFIKKEIAFLGDVLNTTARIEASCNDFGVSFIVSDPLLEKMKPGNDFSIHSLGSVRYRGKESALSVSSVELV